MGGASRTSTCQDLGIAEPRGLGLGAKDSWGLRNEEPVKLSDKS